MLRRVDEPASHLAHSDQSRTRRKPQGALVERRRGQSLQRLRDASASAVVVLGSAACTSRKPRAVCGSVTSIPARAALAGMHAQSPVRLGCDGLAHGPSPQQRPGVGSRPPEARLAGCDPAAAAHPCPPSAVRAPGSGQIPWAPRQRVRPGRAGCWQLACLVRLLSSAASGPPAGGGWQQPEADFLKCKVGLIGRGERQHMGTPERSMPSDAFAVTRTSHWRHTAFGIPKQTRIPRAKSRGGKGTTTAQPVVTSLLTRNLC